MLLNDDKDMLKEANSKLKDIHNILKEYDCDMICQHSYCPFKINLSNRCLIGVLEEVSEGIEFEVNKK
ncbi:hypothetical protein [Romboutsia sp.]|uniref:hypothetical protein n=1 Tax=Romboutsia sp. TaxID=1965302 RepID=UPI002B5428E1|nr:hypothetical protein [Romboutsia sp.]HSQ87969.1 hypothetical protein [Romboutsia sp.]